MLEQLNTVKPLLSGDPWGNGKWLLERGSRLIEFAGRLTEVRLYQKKIRACTVIEVDKQNTNK